ncbi:glutathione S-transferase family protein [Enhygromyxa salina]|uniref:glutathione transferase n=1 Tax=Enhygromyxa salina TaxID=215803 RepID=A0A2S9YWP3_9BACT|nr:glutathione S-transferase [Enhygromyxa salina]PRQ09516.1 Disulfide-bond oxidoreductase YfcG [Enhygromyxa salina]
MLTVHHLDNSRSQRILWLLEELGVEYEIQRYQRDKLTSLAPPELRAVHPLGKSPVITDGDLTIAESGAITEYLVAKYGDGRLVPPADTPERLQYTYWLHYAEGTFMPFMVMTLVFNRLETAPMPFFIRPIAKSMAGKVRANFINPNVTRNLEFMESTLRETTWFTGDEMTAADIQMSFPVEAAAVRANLATKYPKLNEFLQRIHALPAYQRALERGGAYQLLS